MRAWTIVVVMTDTAPALFDRLADRYHQVIPFFAEFAGQLLDVLDPDPGTRLLDIAAPRAGRRGAGQGRRQRREAPLPCSSDFPPERIQGIDVRLMDSTGSTCPVPPTPGHRRLRHPPGHRAAAGTRRAAPRPAAGRERGADHAGPMQTRPLERVEHPGRPVRSPRQRAAARRDYAVAPDLRTTGFADIRTVNLAVHLPVASPQTGGISTRPTDSPALVEALVPDKAAEFHRRASRTDQDSRVGRHRA